MKAGKAAAQLQKAMPGRAARKQPRAPPTGTFRTDIPGVDYGFLSQALGFTMREAQIVIEGRHLRETPPGLKGSQLVPLLIIGANVGIRQRDLAHILGLAHSAVVGLINTFAHMGFVRRAIVPTDHRVYEIFLTRESKQTYDALTDLIERCDAEVGSLFSAAERSRLISLLEKVADFEKT